MAAGILCVMHTLEFTIAGVESVVVSSKCRGNGYGKELVNSMIVAAKGMKVHYLHLISNPKRVVANRLYQSIGFELYDTNCFRLFFKVE